MTKIRPSTRDAIIEAAFLTFNESPGAALSSVADRAGVGRATLHRHFSSRQELMVALAKTAMDELDAAIEAAIANASTHTEVLEQALAAMVPLASRQWFLSHEKLDDEPALAARYAASIAELHQEIDAARSEGSFAADLPTVWVAEAYEELTYAAWVMVRDGHATSMQAADLAWRTFIKGVSP